MWEQVWTLLNSPAGITLAAGALLWVLNHIYAAKPTWAKYEGPIIAGIKWAEKEIPDDSPNKSLRKVDAALRYVMRVHQEARGKPVPEKDVPAIQEGIFVVHDQLEARGTLKT
jgi:hypothetical protein